MNRSYFTAQPTEMVVKQMLLLDLEDLNSLREAYPELEQVCSSDWFWIQKTKRDLPEAPYVFGDVSPRTIYEILIRNDPLDAILLDLPELYTYIKETTTVYIPMFIAKYILEAAKASSNKVLPLLLNECECEFWTKTYDWTVEKGTPETLAILSTRVKPSSRHIAAATFAGRVDNLELLLDLYTRRPIKLFSILCTTVLELEQRGGFVRAVQWLKQKGVLSEKEEAEIAVVLNDIVTLERLDSLPTLIVTGYGRRYGSPEIKKWLVDRPIKMCFQRLLYFLYREPEQFIEFVKDGTEDPNRAMAAVFYDERLRNKARLIDELLTLKGVLITRERVEEELVFMLTDYGDVPGVSEEIRADYLLHDFPGQ